MPVYEYNEGGTIVERNVSVADRDKYPGRLIAPRRVAVCPRGEPEHGSQLLNAWKECEERGGTEDMRRLAQGLGMTRRQVKEACLAPDRVMERPVGPGAAIEIAS